MSPNNPVILEVSRIPVAPGIHAHSIIPELGDGPLETRDDGVVQYTSAHINGVDSEKVVENSGHSTQANPVYDWRGAADIAGTDRAPTGRPGVDAMSRLGRVARLTAFGVVEAAAVLFAAWAILALHYAPLAAPPVNDILAGALAVVTLAALLLLPLRKAALACVAGPALVLSWFLSLQPTTTLPGSLNMPCCPPPRSTATLRTSATSAISPGTANPGPRRLITTPVTILLRSRRWT